MKIRKFCAVLFLLLSISLILFSSFKQKSHAQTQNNRQEEPIWKNKLYEKEVKYENFACNKKDSETVASFFKKHPLKSYLPICHNDCPIIKCRPVIPISQIVKDIDASATISVHVLVNEQGKVLYARALTGTPVLRLMAQKGACETQFKEYSFGKHQGVMHFTISNNEFLEVPNRANEVW